MKSKPNPRKTLLFATCYREHSKRGASHSRYAKWLRYYINIAPHFGNHSLVLVDDGSSPKLLVKLGVPIFDATKKFPDNLPDSPCIFTFPKHLGRKSMSEYAGWWRSFSFSGELATYYNMDRVIHVESDAFVLTKELAKWLCSVESGWNVLYVPRWKFPESQIQVIIGPQIKNLRKYFTLGDVWWSAKRQPREYAEFLLPFTHVEKKFKGDRYTDYDDSSKASYPADADYVTQAHLSMSFPSRLL